MTDKSDPGEICKARCLGPTGQMQTRLAQVLLCTCNVQPGLRIAVDSYFAFPLCPNTH